MLRTLCFALLLGLTSAATAQAQQNIQVKVENLQPNSGFYFTPVWLAFHDGSFDFFDEGVAASASLEALAEGGDFSGLEADFINSAAGQSTALFDPEGFAGAPVFDPGSEESLIINIDANQRYLSFASMIIPSNDSFFGNDDAMQWELLDGAGNFVGDFSFELTLADLWDSGTEVNDGLGAAFSANGGTSTDEGGVVSAGPDLSNFDGTDTVAGSTIDFSAASSSPVFRLTVSAVPEPTSLGVLGALGCSVLLLRRRRSS